MIVQYSVIISIERVELVSSTIYDSRLQPARTFEEQVSILIH